MRKACGEAVEELRAARLLLQKQGVQIEKQAELLKLEKEISSKLENLRSLDAHEKQELRNALAAKDRELASLRLEITELKRQRWTFWKVIKTAAVGVAGGIILGAVLTKD